MSNFVYKGPEGSDPDEVCSIYDDRLLKGVNTRSDGAVIKQGPVQSTPAFDMPMEERFKQVMRRAAPLVPEGMREAFLQMITPEALAIMGGVFAAAAIGAYFGVTEIALLLMGLSFLLMAKQAWDAGKHLGLAINITASAKSEQDLDEAARHVADCVAAIGVELFLALVTKGLGKIAKTKAGAKATAAATDVAAKVTAKAAGMAQKHFDAFIQMAANTGGKKYIIVVRNTKAACIKWIEKGFPPKPMEIKTKTLKDTGIVTCNEEGIVNSGHATVQAAIKEAHDAKFYVVEKVDGKLVGRRPHLSKPGQWDDLDLDLSKQIDEWTPAVGQVIDPMSKRPLTGDYDLMGVIDAENTRPMLALVASEGKAIKNVLTKEVRAIIEEFSKRFPGPTGQRIRHGSHETFASLDTAGDCTVFFPDGTVKAVVGGKGVNEKSLQELYATLGRQARKADTPPK